MERGRSGTFENLPAGYGQQQTYGSANSRKTLDPLTAPPPNEWNLRHNQVKPF